MMRQVLVKLALIGFLCRALVPGGFMPAPISDGGPIRFCPGGAAGALLTALAERGAAAHQDALDRSGHDSHADHHHGPDRDTAASGVRAAGDAPPHGESHHDHEQSATHESWDRCPVGTAFALAFLGTDFTLPLIALEHVVARGDSSSPVWSEPPAHYHARAPPYV